MNFLPKLKFGMLWAIYAFVSAYHLFQIVINRDELADISKYALMPLLIIIALAQSKKNWLLVLALAFSWFGDVLLVQQKYTAQFFIFGLVAFLTAHIFYVALNIKTAKPLRISIWHFLAFVPMLVWAIFLLNLVSKNAASYLLPIQFYTLALCALYFSAMMCFKSLPIWQFSVLFIGIVLFIASDSMIAINKFISPFANAGFSIMITYILAQALIVFSYVEMAKK